MDKPLIIFGVSKPNVYSYASLLSSIEQDMNILNNYDVKIYKGDIYEITPLILQKNGISLKNRPFVVIPFSLFTSQFPSFQFFMENNLKTLKKINPNIKVIVGGWHCTGRANDVLCTGADYVVIGEGEIIFPYILNELLNQDSILLSNPTHKILSSKNKDLFKTVNLDDYTPFSEKFRVFCPIEISRGCPFRCNYCQTGHFYDKMRHASVDQIIKWVKKAVEIRYDRVWFTTPNAFSYGSKNGVGINPPVVERLLKNVKKIENLEEVFFGAFPSEIRPDFINKEIMDAVHPYIDNKSFTIGAQTASDSLLKKINRGHSFSDVLNTLDIISDYGYISDVDFIFGLPGETQEDIALTIDFFRYVLKSTKKIRIHTHTFMPLPGTPYENENTPPKISSELESIVGQLASKNKAFGQYVKQSKFKKNAIK